MALWAGQGGKVLVTPPGGGQAVNWPVGKWRLSKKRSLANVTNSTSGGIKQRVATIRDQQATFELPWDDTVNPEASGFSEGSIIGLELDLGTSGHKFTTASFIIENCDYDNDEDEDAIRLSVSGYANVAFTYS